MVTVSVERQALQFRQPLSGANRSTMQGSNNAARVNLCLRRASALMREISNSRNLHLSQRNVQKVSATASYEGNRAEVSSLDQRLRRQVASDGLRTFIEKVTAKPKEARLWLKYFKSKAYWDEGRPFCVLHITEDIFYDVKCLETFTWSAAFLMQNNMKPVIVFGMRRRTKETMQDIENKLEILGSRLQRLLHNHGVESGLFTANNQLLTYSSTSKLEVDVNVVTESLLANQIPIVTNLLADDSSKFKYRLFDPMSVAEVITKTTKPMKLMLLSSEKGIRDDCGEVISDIVLPFDLPSVLNNNWYKGDARKKIERVGNLLEALPPESSVILTSADTVIQELFTHHGSGTMIKRSEKVMRYKSLEEVNLDELRLLLSNSFQRPLPETYFSDISDNLDCIYVSEGYSAAVIILRDQNIPVPYMDKFAVRTSSQGLGLTTQVWSEIVKDYQQLFWRSKPSNSGALGWYNTVCQGSWKDASWTVFWYGLQSYREVFPLIDYALKRKQTFVSDQEQSVFENEEENEETIEDEGEPLFGFKFTTEDMRESDNSLVDGLNSKKVVTEANCKEVVSSSINLPGN